MKFLRRITAPVGRRQLPSVAVLALLAVCLHDLVVAPTARADVPGHSGRRQHVGKGPADRLSPATDADQQAYALPDALPYAEWRKPTGFSKCGGPRKRRPAAGVMILIHGGGWNGNNPERVYKLRSIGRRFRRCGYITYNVDYRSGKASFFDVVRFFDLARERYPRLPIGAYGASAGGHLALLLAENRPVRAVIAEASPTDLTVPGDVTSYFANLWFGSDGLTRWSPITYVQQLTGSVLLVDAENDRSVPPIHLVEFRKALPRAQTVVLKAGRVPFIHSDVAATALRRARAREVKFVSRRVR